VPDGEYLLRRSRVDVSRYEEFELSQKERRKLRRKEFSFRERRALRRDFRALRNELSPLQRQEPNSRFALIPLRLMMYNSVDAEKNNWWTRWMRRAGEPPVIFDSIYAEQSVRQMQQFLINNGHFNSEVSFVHQNLRRPKRMGLIFNVDPGLGYHYRNVNIDVRDDSLTHLFNDWQSRTLIKSGNPYNVGILEAERARIVRQLQDLGYFSFNRDNIEFLIDSSLNANLMDITMLINTPRAGGHNEIYRFADIKISPTNIKPRTITSKLAIKTGDPYSLSNVERTYENLLDLRVFRSTNISIQPQPIDTNNPEFLLNTSIELQQSLQNMWEVQFEATTASSLMGTALNASFQNRNLFGGAEIFSLRLRGLLEMQYPLNPSLRRRKELEFIDNYDIGISANLDFPRFVFLGQTNVHRPQTSINLGYSYRHRFEIYDRQLTNLSFSYSWRQPRVSHTLFPLDINLVNISLKPEFAKQLDTLAKNNRRLQEQYKDHFIFATRYVFSFSGQQGNRPIGFNAFRFSIESSGNSLYALSNLLNAPKHGENNQYHFLHLAYAQYLRTDADFRRYWFLTDNQIIVTRLMGGMGYVYGNSTVLPYEKGFFAGGNNNIRAWPMSQLGPGSFYNPEFSNIERVGDIVLVGNIEYRFPIAGAFKGALFVDAGNIWLRNESDDFPKGEFVLKNIPNDLAVGGGFGLRWDLNFFVIRLDAAAPLRNPAKPNGEKWVIRDIKPRDFVLNFGIGYPF
jgi:outer membrane protein assembly factor BamA